MRHADLYDYIMIAYFVLLFAVANWKGNDFLQMPFKPRLILGIGLWLPLAAWVVIQHLIR